MSTRIEEIRDDATMEGSAGLLGIVISSFRVMESPNGTQFLTDNLFPLQVATIKHPPGYIIKPHVHPSRISKTEGPPTEVLIVLNGSVWVDFYRNMGEKVARRYLGPRDIVILIAGGHGFEVDENGVEMIEVRTGPYLGDKDKVRF